MHPARFERGQRAAGVDMPVVEIIFPSAVTFVADFVDNFEIVSQVKRRGSSNVVARHPADAIGLSLVEVTVAPLIFHQPVLRIDHGRNQFKVR